MKCPYCGSKFCPYLDGYGYCNGSGLVDEGNDREDDGEQEEEEDDES